MSNSTVAEAELDVLESLGQTLLMIMLVQLAGYVVKRLQLGPTGFEAGMGPTLCQDAHRVRAVARSEM